MADGSPSLPPGQKLYPARSGRSRARSMARSQAHLSQRVRDLGPWIVNFSQGSRSLRSWNIVFQRVRSLGSWICLFSQRVHVWFTVHPAAGLQLECQPTPIAGALLCSKPSERSIQRSLATLEYIWLDIQQDIQPDIQPDIWPDIKSDIWPKIQQVLAEFWPDLWQDSWRIFPNGLET